MARGFIYEIDREKRVKQCSGCEKMLPFEDFYKNTNGLLRAKCRHCFNLKPTKCPKPIEKEDYTPEMIARLEVRCYSCQKTIEANQVARTFGKPVFAKSHAYRKGVCNECEVSREALKQYRKSATASARNRAVKEREGNNTEISNQYDDFIFC